MENINFLNLIKSRLFNIKKNQMLKNKTMNYKLFVLLFLTNIILMFQVSSQELESTKAITLNPLGIAGSLILDNGVNVNIKYEKVQKEKVSYLIGIEARTLLISKLIDGEDNTSDKLVYTSFGIQPELRFYPKQAPYQFFLGISYPISLVHRQYFKYDKKISYDLGCFMGLAGRLGYKFSKKIIFEPSIYAGYAIITDSNKEMVIPQSLATLASPTPFFGINMQFGFFLK